MTKPIAEMTDDELETEMDRLQFDVDDAVENDWPLEGVFDRMTNIEAEMRKRKNEKG